MTFIHPEALFLLPVMLLAGALLLYLFRWKAASLDMFAHGPVLPPLVASSSGQKQRLKAVLLVVALGVTVIALARPIYGVSEPPAPKPGQGDVVVALDVSLSMAARDASPSRLELAKVQIANLIDHLQGDRIGLVVFAGDATLRFPTTFDYGVAKVLTHAVEPDTAPLAGSAPASGIRTAVLALRQSESPLRAIFLLSDGEDFVGRTEEAMQLAKDEKIPVYTIGVGGPVATTIPLKDGTTKKDRSGAIVQTKLEDAPLRQLAAGTGGTYAHASGTGRELQHAYEALRLVGQNRPDSGPSNDLTSLFVLVALLLLIAEYIISERRMPRPTFAPLAGALLPIVVLASGACSSQTSVFTLNEDGAKFYQQSQFTQALDMFRQAQVRRPDMPELSLNTGAALYKTGEYDRALREDQRALIGDKEGIRQRAQYNMGNAYYQLGQFREAYEAYKRALLADPTDVDAKVNLELALRRLQEASQNNGQQQQGPGENTPQGQQQPQQGGQPQDGQQPNNQGSNGTPQDNANPSNELRQELRDAGAEISLEEALRILDALRDKEDQVQGRYQQQPSGRNSNNRPEKDW